MGKEKKNSQDNDDDNYSINTKSHTDKANGVTQTTTTEQQVLEDGTKIITHVQTLNQEHEGEGHRGRTTVTNTNTRRIETITVEERVVGEELTFWDCFLCCCPCFKFCFGKKKEEEVEDVEKDGEDDGGKSSKWKPVAKK
eukprot:CAMPEP_0172325054 /NCGR_PEP_ID=MMETSP1058-20130122/53000_1 /TAXON_ID=83371 /ORGANISM="Detonula confervacea, Strain CCMP 353" /LENGTH=139 /DNA_ID=CAMNT_0013041499 /DNA_START=54 /DNA_END=473 /DNA_ORIENTATION=-